MGPLPPTLAAAVTDGRPWVAPQGNIVRGHFTRWGQFPLGQPPFLGASLLGDISHCAPELAESEPRSLGLRREGAP